LDQRKLLLSVLVGLEERQLMLLMLEELLVFKEGIHHLVDGALLVVVAQAQEEMDQLEALQQEGLNLLVVTVVEGQTAGPEDQLQTMEIMEQEEAVVVVVALP
jgi:transketolase C-terminal domain/subunit